jgi:hypothetical protein
MPVYFFNIQEGTELIGDPDGSDLADPAAARAEALVAARSLLAAAVIGGKLPLSHAIRVTDAAGHPVLTVTFAESVGVAVAAPAARDADGT